MDVAVVNIRLSLLDSALCVYSDCDLRLSRMLPILFSTVFCVSRRYKEVILESHNQ